MMKKYLIVTLTVLMAFVTFSLIRVRAYAPVYTTARYTDVMPDADLTLSLAYQDYYYYKIDNYDRYYNASQVNNLAISGSTSIPICSGGGPTVSYCWTHTWAERTLTVYIQKQAVDAYGASTLQEYFMAEDDKLYWTYIPINFMYNRLSDDKELESISLDRVKLFSLDSEIHWTYAYSTSSTVWVFSYNNFKNYRTVFTYDSANVRNYIEGATKGTLTSNNQWTWDGNNLMYSFSNGTSNEGKTAEQLLSIFKSYMETTIFNNRAYMYTATPYVTVVADANYNDGYDTGYDSGYVTGISDGRAEQYAQDSNFNDASSVAYDYYTRGETDATMAWKGLIPSVLGGYGSFVVTILTGIQVFGLPLGDYIAFIGALLCAYFLLRIIFGK
jgi:hypothetical protein